MSIIIESISLIFSFIAYIVTQGALFGDRFKNNRFVFAVLILSMVLSFYFLVGDVADLMKDHRPTPVPLKSAHEYFLRGREYAQRGKIELANADFDSALVLDPSFCEAFNAKGLLHTNARDWDRAMGDFNAAISCNPNFKDAKSNLARALDLKTDATLAPLWEEIGSR